MAEGTVYFKDSPALEGVQEATRTSFSADLLRGGLEDQSSGGTAATSDAHTAIPLWKRLLHVVWMKEDSSCSCTEVAQVVNAILHSGLLNEEHHHLVASVMRANNESELDDKGVSCGRDSVATPPSLADEIEGASARGSTEQPLDTPTALPQCQKPQSSSIDSTRAALLLSSAAVLVLFPLWWVPGTLLVLITLLAASAAAMLCVWRCVQRRATKRGVARVVSYVEGFDRLLCLVAESVRYLQEMEALSKGYARSSVIGGHFHQVGGAGMGVSHCVVLRRVLHQVVSGLIGRINKCVLLGGTCPTGPPPTMGGGRGHLVREEELGLAELKEQCHTLAVGNSGMLQDICLSLMGFSLKGASEQPTDPLLFLWTLSPSLHRLTLDAEKGSRQLKWALSFEEAYCSEPEGCMKGLVKAGGRGPSPSPLSESLLRGLRGMDLKGQLVVRGVRDCVALLQANMDSLPQVEAHLLAMQTHLSALNADLTDALQILQPQTSSDTENGMGSACSSDRDEAEHSQPQESVPPDGSPPSSDEEKVYEAYVSKCHNSEEEWPTGGEDPECPRRQSDLPIKMVNELKNVLSLRELQQTERRALRRRRRRRRGGADGQTDRRTDGPTDGHHGIQTHVQCSSSSSQLPSSQLNSVSVVDSPQVAEEAAVRGPVGISSPRSSGLPAGSSLKEKPVVGVSAPPSLMNVSPLGESVPKLQEVGSLVALLARQQRSAHAEECFGDSNGSEQDE